MSALQHPCFVKQDSLSLSGDALIELIKAVHEKNLPFRFRAEGCSMSPFVKNGDIITISPLSKSSVGHGDIVAFVHPRTATPFVHRIIKKEDGFMRIRGDRSTIEDGLIPELNILGPVTRIERDGKNIHFGLGVEKYIIAMLSERNLLVGLLNILSGMRRAVNGIFCKGKHE